MEHPEVIKFSTGMILEIKELSRKLGMTQTHIIRNAVKKYLDEELRNDTNQNQA